MESQYLEKAYALAREINTAGDIRAIIDTVTDHLPGVLDAKYCSLFLMNPASGTLEMKAHNHEYIGEDPFINIEKQQDSVMNMVMEKGESVIIKDIHDEIGMDNKDKYTSKSFMCILIKHENRVLGVINMADKHPGDFTEDDMLIASIVAELLGPLIARRELSSL